MDNNVFGIKNLIEKVRENHFQDKYIVETHGCQMNEHDSNKIKYLLEDMGFIPTEDENEANIIVINTCSVRHSAEDKVLGRLGTLKHVKKSHPGLKIALCGCMMQRKVSRDLVLTKYPHVDIIFGTNNIHRLPQLILASDENKSIHVDIEETYSDIDNRMMVKSESNNSAYINIMYGCNNFCTYCIVPYTRGREVSRPSDDIMDEISNLVSDGVKEVTLLGQNVNSYGKGLDEDINFSGLLKKISTIDGIERIYFLTSHPKDLSDELIECYRDIDKLANYLHLPVQSGSDRILKLMNRHYSRQDFFDIIEKIRKVRPDIAISTDIMVGFPGETEEDFLDTIDLVEKVKFDNAFTFLYSRREGTKAWDMENQIPKEIKDERFKRLLDSLYQIQRQKNMKLIGTVQNVLVENISKNNPNKMTGRTDTFKLVHFDGGEELIGKFLKVKINNANTFSLEGDIVDQ